MTIIDKIAEAIQIHLPLNVSKEHRADAAQAAWDIVKAEMLGDDVVTNAVLGLLISNNTIEECDHIDLVSALTAAMQKMEE